MQSRPPATAYAAALGMSVAFGLAFVATKYALRGFEPLLIALARFTIAGGVLWLAWRLRRRRERATWADMGRLAALGFVSLTLYFTLEINALARTTASMTAILIATIPIFVSVLSAVFLGERAGAARWAGVLVSFAGVVALVQLGGSAAGGTMTGNLLALGAALTAATYTLMARSLLVSRSALYVTAYQNLFGALFIAPLALVEALVVGVRRPGAESVAAVVYLGVFASMAAYLLLNYAFRFLPASRAAVFINFTPVVTVVAAFLLLGERLTWGQAAAAVVIVAGVLLASRSGAAARSPSAG